jgi:serine/threonine-protein phosphatase 2A activator
MLDQARMAASSYHVPRKGILTKENLGAFQESETYVDIVNYIRTLNESILGVKLSDDCSVSPVRSSYAFAVRA